MNISPLMHGPGVGPVQAFERAAALHAQGQLQEAEDLYDQVLAANPRHFDSVYRLGLIRLQQGQFAEAESLFRRATKLDKRSADAQHHLAVALTGLGRLEEAVPRYEKVLGLRPRYAEAYNNLGYALQQLGRHHEAIGHYKRALDINPSYAEAHNNLGNALVALARAKEAIAEFEQALLLNPSYAEAHNNLASTLMTLDRHEEAVAHCEQAIAFKPHYLEAHLNLANAFVTLDRIEEAAVEYQKVLTIDPTRADAHSRLGRALLTLGRADSALPHFKQAVALKPDLVEAHNGFGSTLQVLGRLEEAITVFEKAITVAPRSTGAYLNLAMAMRLTADDPRFVAMQELARNMELLDVNNQISLRFALGKVFADLGDPEQSFRHLVDANYLKRQQLAYDEAKRLARFERIRATFTAELLSDKTRLGDPSCVPVFIVGMPRSGTTLIEQILASHPKVFGAGELRDFGRLARGARGADGTEFPECVPSLTSGQLRELGQSYSSAVQGLAPAAERIIDKMPYNFEAIGLIHLALPNARIIHACRDPRDTALSCFSILFAEGQEFTYDLAELGRYIRGYHTLMEHWRRVLPEGAILDVQYEDLVDNLEDGARTILAHCELDWNDACLAFHRTQRPVRTASVRQVRQPIYRSSVGRWRPYESKLQPLFQALAGQ
jgi:tetratricopeptide (TPR) repeat protein